MPEARPFWNSFSERALDLLFPPKCALCDVLSDAPICAVCLGEFHETSQQLRPVFDGPLAYIASLYAYEGRAAQAVRRLKYSRSTVLARTLGAMMAEGYEALGLGQVDLIVPIPIHWTRKSIRGFNQAEVLSEALPWEKVRPGVLKRVRATRPQVGLSREERIRNLAGAFRADPSVAGKDILLVDDVVTSGHTAEECAAELKRMGAGEIGVLALTGESR